MRTIQLEVSGPLPAAPMLGALAAHSLARVQVTTIEGGGGPVRGTVRRVLRLDGHAVPVEVSVGDDAVELRLPDELDAVRCELAIACVREWLDLDLEPGAVELALGADPRLGPLLARRPGLRIVGHPDPFEAAITTVIGQRVSLAAGRVFGTRLVDLFAPTGDLVEFPGPETVAAADPAAVQRAVGVTGARARTVVELAALFAAGLDPRAEESARVRERLLAVRGIGPWTVEYLAVRVLGDRDAFPSGDLVLQRALGVTAAREAETLAEPWRPWRAYALFHLWTEQSYSSIVRAPAGGSIVPPT